MFDLSPVCAPKRTSADHSKFMGLRPRLNALVDQAMTSTVSGCVLLLVVRLGRFLVWKWCSESVGWISVSAIRRSPTIKSGLRLPPPLSELRRTGRLTRVMATPLARTAEFVETDQSDSTSPAPFAKIFLFSPDPNQIYIHHRLVPHRGVSRSSRTRGGMRWTRQRWARDGMAGRVSACERSTAR
jgi:hypothetical protein